MVTEETRALLQQRLGLFTRLWGCLIAAAVVFLLVVYNADPSSRPGGSWIVHIASAIGCLVLGALWLGVHRRRLSLRQLYTIDALNVVVIGTIQGMSAYFSSDRESAIYLSFIWQIFVVFSRVTLIPSTALRTATVTGLSFVPLMVAAVALAIWREQRLPIRNEVAFVIAGLFFVLVAVVLATTAARVIYGLRRQVTRAMQLGAYTLGERIGAGGMGVVHRASHALLRRPAAIKLLQVDKVSATSLRRFEHEVQQTSRLTHPNTVVVLDYGHSAEGLFYYVMEYLDGLNLDALVARHGPQPAPRVIHIVMQVCGSLEEAHAIGLIHRDIKPANIILCQRGLTPDVAKVVDFGLVKELDVEVEAGDSGILAGTPAYMPPEAVTDPQLVGPRSDLYSLGAVAYFLLTGTPVFSGKTLDVCAQHAAEPPEPPSQRTENPIPAELETLILACLAKNPDHRPASARDLRAALAALPAAREWNEAAALDWWRAEAAKRAAGQVSLEQTTVTIDLSVRVVSQDRATDQAT